MGHFSINYNEQKTDRRAYFQSRKDNIHSLGNNDHHLVQMIELAIAEKKSRSQKMDHQKRKNPRPERKSK